MKIHAELREAIENITTDLCGRYLLSEGAGQGLLAKVLSSMLVAEQIDDQADHFMYGGE